MAGGPSKKGTPDMLSNGVKRGLGTMKWLRLLASLCAAPILYGVLCLPLLGWWLSFFPSKVNDLGGTFYLPLVVSIEVFQAAVLLLCGMTVALIGGSDRWQKVCLAAATVDMLIIGVMVQRQFWEALPVWHHWIFFLLILIMMPLGSAIIRRLRGKLVSDDAAVRLS